MYLLQTTTFSEISDLLFAAFFAWLFALTASFIAWKKGFFKLPYAFEDTGKKISGKDVFIIFCLFFLIQILLTPAALLIWIIFYEGTLGTFGQAEENPILKGYFNVLAILSYFAVVLGFNWAISSQKRELIWNRAKGNFQRNLKNFLIGAFSWLLIFPLVIFIGKFVSAVLHFVFPHPPVDQLAVKNLKILYQYPILFWLTAVLVVSIGPLIEEFMFRGILQTWLKQKIGLKKGIALSSAIFALFHYSGTQGIANIEFIVELFLLSCFMGFLYERQGTLWAPIGLHMTFNALSLGFLLLSEQINS